MIGQGLALLAAVSVSSSAVFTRRAVFILGEPNAAFYIGVFVGTVLFSLALAFAGHAVQLTTISGQALASLIGAGIVGTGIGRWLTINSVRLIGANLTGPLLRMSVVVAVILGVTLMDEPLTLGITLSVILIFTGVVLISIEGGDTRAPDSTISKGDRMKGIVSALLAGVCYGTGPVLTKVAIQEGNSPITAGFVRNWTAMVLVVVLLSRSGERRKLSKVDKTTFLPILFGSIFTSLAQLCRNWALEFIPVSMMQPLTTTSILITIPLSYAFNRKIELFTWKIMVGAILVVSGVFVIFQV
jgi:drug/metabolite transporter (DMT)-like permease